MMALSCNTFDINIRKPYAYKRAHQQFRPELINKHRGVHLFSLHYKSPVTSPYQRNNTVHSYLVEGKNTNQALILLHGLGMNNLQRLVSFASPFARKGITVLLIEIPYHMHRTPQGFRSGELFILPDAVKTYNSFEQTVLDTMKGIDFLEKRGYDRFHIAGISLGTIPSLITQALDTRIRKSVLILGGGDIEMLKWRSLSTRNVRKQHRRIGVTHGVCINERKALKNYLGEVKSGKSPTSVQARVACYYFEPLVFALLIQRDKVLMINGLFDEIIPKQSTLALWQALRKPEIVWYPLTHFSIYLAYPLIIKKMTSFLMIGGVRPHE
jgi:hypothetical protein